MQAQSRPDTPDDDNPGKLLDDRALRLETTFDGAGVMSGDLTPECAALVRTVLEALSAPRGADHNRTHAQRYHDALAEAMNRLVAAGLVPARAGQPAKVIAHISLPDLLALDTGSKLQQAWTERVRTRWAAARAAASVSGSDGTAWLDGDTADAFACDASITPIVTGDVNPAVLDDLVRLCLELTGHSPAHCHPADPADPAPQAPPADPAPPAGPCSPVPPTPRGRDALERAIIGAAVALLSGPGGLASFRAASSSAPGWPARACRWTSGSAKTSPPGSGRPSSNGTSTAGSPGGYFL
jgi:hypothetical protein